MMHIDILTLYPVLDNLPGMPSLACHAGGCQPVDLLQSVPTNCQWIYNGKTIVDLVTIGHGGPYGERQRCFFSYIKST